MRKLKKVMKESSHSRVYKMARRITITKCQLCSPHKGCNRWTDRKPSKSWKHKTKRSKQFKE